VILGRVVGQVWATRKNPYLGGHKLLVVRPLAWHLPDHEADHLVAVDPVGAEVGEDVVVCLGLPARWALGDTRHPVEASIAAIVDRVEVYGEAAAEPAFRFREGCEPADLEVRP
jgi:ethanolamine utilization protein EutN